MNNSRGKFGRYSTSTSRTNPSDISNLSLRELMAEEFPVDPLVAGRKLLPYPASKSFIRDEPRRPENREHSLFNQRDRGVLSMTEYVNSFHDTSRSEDPRRYEDYFARERPYPDREFKGMNNSRFGDVHGSYYNGVQHRKSKKEHLRPYERQGVNEQATGGLSLSEYVNSRQGVNEQASLGLNLSEYVNSRQGVNEQASIGLNLPEYANRRQGVNEQASIGLNLPEYANRRQGVNEQASIGLNLPEYANRRQGVNEQASIGLNLPEYANRRQGVNEQASIGLNLPEYANRRQGVNKQSSGGLNLSDCVKRVFTADESSNVVIANKRNEKKKAFEELLAVQDTASAEVPDYVKNLLAKVLSRDKTVKKESGVSSVEANQSPSGNKSSKNDLAEYVQMLYSRIESDREKILKYEDLLKKDMAEEITIKSEKNPEETTSAQSSKLGIRQSNELSSETVKNSEKSQENVAESELSKDADSSSESVEIIEEVAPVKPSLPRPPELPSLMEGVLEHRLELESSSRDHQHRKGPASRLPTKSRSRSPRRSGRKSPGRMRESPPKRVRSRSPDKFETSSKNSNNLVGALKLIISAIKRTNTDYSLDMIQDNIPVDFFHLPSALKVSLLVCGFQLKLSTSSSAHGYHWTMLRDVLEFSQGCDLNHKVYVEANAHDDSVDIHGTKAYELAEYFRDTDVTIDFKTLDTNLVKEFQAARQSDPWSHLHPTQNIPGPSRPSIFSRIGNRR